ncbi:PAS domain S-box protein [Accumulibacter sp.]|uniref:PAS domain S-box protein n=1 Tax=Accumulibacter sp. TaxID=2053492 RepID=UPI00262C2A27|nr:PAS domain S-box protein [Accumulibacter sp.]
MTEHRPLTAVADILLIEDGENPSVLGSVLSTHGYDVRPPAEAATALTCASREPPDLILLDLNVPGMDAYEVCRRLRADPPMAGIPIILLCPSGEPFDKVLAFEVGASDYLSQPFESAEVLARIDTQLRLRRLRARVEAQNQALQAEIFERKRAEDALRQVSRHLEGLVVERTEDLIRNSQELRREIQGRIAIEEAQRENEAKYRRLCHSLRDAFVSVDMTGRVEDANPAFQEMLGYTLTELRNLSHTQLTPACWHTSESRIIDQQLLPRGFSDSYEKEYVRRDGTVVPVEVRAFLRTSVAGVPDGIYAIVHDVTQRKRALACSMAALEEEEALRHRHAVKKPAHVVTALRSIPGRATADPAGRVVRMEKTGYRQSIAPASEPRCDTANLADIAFDQFLERLLMQVDKQHTPAGVVLHRTLAAVTLDIGIALPCSLIVSGLVSNALQRGFPAGRRGRVDVELAIAMDGAVGVTVSDDGVGLPAGFRLDRATKSLAWQLLLNLTRQIDGALVVVPGERTCFALSFRSKRQANLNQVAKQAQESAR